MYDARVAASRSPSEVASLPVKRSVTPDPNQLPLFVDEAPASAAPLARCPRRPALDYDDDFFDRKRPWSHIKDTVLVGYLKPYLHKVTRAVGERVLLVDGFAGPGRFKDGSLGSPLLMLDVADSNVPGKCAAVFANVDRSYHAELVAALQTRAGSTRAIPLDVSAGDLLQQIARDFQGRSESLFIYLDPFGVKGCELAQMRALLNRPKQSSTEFLINLSTPTVLRLAGKGPTEWATLDAVLDGRWWQEAIADGTADGAADRVVAGYCRRLTGYGFRFTGACPVRDPASGQLRYHMVFCSRSSVALRLMNEVMIEAHDRHLHERDAAGTLFDQSDWRDWRTPTGLQQAIVTAARTHPGLPRKEMWTRILGSHFMAYRHREFIDELRHLLKNHRIEILPPGRFINDETRIWVAGGRPSVMRVPTPTPRPAVAPVLGSWRVEALGDRSRRGNP